MQDSKDDAMVLASLGMTASMHHTPPNVGLDQIQLNEVRGLASTLALTKGIDSVPFPLS
jgi:hypothetical protein